MKTKFGRWWDTHTHCLTYGEYAKGDPSLVAELAGPAFNMPPLFPAPVLNVIAERHKNTMQRLDMQPASSFATHTVRRMKRRTCGGCDMLP